MVDQTALRVRPLSQYCTSVQMPQDTAVFAVFLLQAKA